jgi:tyrosyl-tRNA synthetase
VLSPTSRLGASHAALMDILQTDPDLNGTLTDILGILEHRRTLDLSDLDPAAQAELIRSRAVELLPSTARLVELLAGGRPLVVKFGIDPTAAEAHVGHAVPMLVASRLQRMGHRVVFIVGDITARIGDPSGRTADRPALTEDDIARNLASYRDQVGPFVDFDRAEFRRNGEWLAGLTLPRFLSVLEKVPVAASLQRDDFRDRLAAGNGLTMAELVYSVVMALDSVETVADIEIGGLDQLLNMHMCRRVMENAGLVPEVIVATDLIEGIDGSGTKMSKSRGTVVGLAAAPRDVFGKLMSVPDRVLPAYLRALTELLDPEVNWLLDRVRPMRVKTLLAADVTAAIHGVGPAEATRAGFAAQFSRRRLSEATDLPVVACGECGQSTVAELFVTITSLVASRGQVRRVAAGGGLRLVVEAPGREPETVVLSPADADRSVSTVVNRANGRVFLKCGRAVVEIRPAS